VRTTSFLNSTRGVGAARLHMPSTAEKKASKPTLNSRCIEHLSSAELSARASALAACLGVEGVREEEEDGAGGELHGGQLQRRRRLAPKRVPQ